VLIDRFPVSLCQRHIGGPGILDGLLGIARTGQGDHFITKQVFNDTPMRVEYTLTEQGRKLSSLLGGLCDFAETITLAKEA
jgi:hypothetical protein